MNYPSELPEQIKVLHKLYSLTEAADSAEEKTTAILNKLVSNNLAGIWKRLGSMEAKSSRNIYWFLFIDACERAFFWNGYESSKQAEINDNKANIIKTTKTLKRLITGAVQNDELKVAYLFPDNGLKLQGDAFSSSIEMTPSLDSMKKNGTAACQQINYASTPLSEGLDRLVELIREQSNRGIARDKGRAHFNHFKKNMTEFFIDNNNNPLEEIVAKLATVILNDGTTYTKDMVVGRE